MSHNQRHNNVFSIVTLITYNYFNLSFNCSDAILGISWCRRTKLSHTLRTCQMASFQGCSRPALVSWVCLCPGPRASVFSEHASPGFQCCYRFRNMSGSCTHAFRYALIFPRETDWIRFLRQWPYRFVITLQLKSQITVQTRSVVFRIRV